MKNKLFFYFLIFSLGLMPGLVFAQPPAPVGFLGVTGPTDICETSVATVSFSAPIGTAPFNFYYTVNGSPLQMLTSNTITANITVSGAPGTYVYTLNSISDANYGPQPIAGQTRTITVYPMPSAVAGGTYSPSICPDQGTATVSGANFANGSVNWGHNGAGSIISGAGTASPVYMANLSDAGKTIKLTMTVNSNNLCASEPPAVAEYYVPVRAAMSASISLSNSKKNYCLNESVLLLMSGSGSTPPYTFTYAESGINKSAVTIGSNSLVAVGGLTTSSASGGLSFNLVSIADGSCTQRVVGGPVTMTVHAGANASLAGDPEACRLESPFPMVHFTASGSQRPYLATYTVNDVLQPQLQLNTTSNPVIDSLKFPNSTLIAGVYTYSLISIRDSYGCEAQIGNSRATVTIHERPNPRFLVVPERVSILQPTVKVQDFSISTTNWLWKFGDPQSSISPFQDPGEFTYKDTGTYTIKLIASNAICTDSTSQRVHVYLPYTLYIPDAFSPNNDGVNDVFSPVGDGFIWYDMSIYDRWGNLLFYTEDIHKGWDGRIMGGSGVISQMDVCVYVINVTAADEKTYIYYGTVSSVPR